MTSERAQAGEAADAYGVAGEWAVLRRTAVGWSVGDEELPDLTCAMVLADLIAAELPDSGSEPSVRPATADDDVAGDSTRTGDGGTASSDKAVGGAKAGGSGAARDSTRAGGRTASSDKVAGGAKAGGSGAARDSTRAGGSGGSASSDKATGGAGTGGGEETAAAGGDGVAGTSTAAARAAGTAAAPAAGTGTAGETAAGADSGHEEARRLRTTVSQLERALAVRIRVEQAIGVLAERHRIRPRQAFEQLRTVARGRGQRVIDIAGDVIASATNPLLPLPEELSRPSVAQRQRAGSRRRARETQ